MKIPKMERRCIKCGKPQPLLDSSNENWNCYDAKAVCECGGKFVMYFDGKPIAKEAENGK